MDYLTSFSQIFSSLSGLSFIVGVVLLYKTGALEFLINLKKNGNGNGQQEKQLKELSEKIEALSGNHLEHISQKLDKVIENTTKEIIFLEDIRNEIKGLK